MKDIELIEMLDIINKECAKYTGINQIEVYDGNRNILTDLNFKITHGYIELIFSNVNKE